MIYIKMQIFLLIEIWHIIYNKSPKRLIRLISKLNKTKIDYYSIIMDNNFIHLANRIIPLLKTGNPVIRFILLPIYILINEKITSCIFVS